MTVPSTVVPEWLDVSRETLDRLQAFRQLVEKWNPVINLVARSGLAAMWDRHILDSAQIFDASPSGARLWCDLGSGGGFPGLVVAILAKEKRPELEFVLVESDRRKAVFLREAARILGLDILVEAQRIEDIKLQQADILSARALAPLPVLCGYAARHLQKDGVAIFPKGAMAAEEIAEARRSWTFSLSQLPSRTEVGASILVLRDIRHV